jgi:arylamine N-acetyltransferase
VERFVMPDALANEMCDRIGVSRPGTLSEAGDFYRAWVEKVPFDSIAKALALRDGTRPPGSDPIEFCDRWLATGVGGTCWGHVAAMAAVLGSAGFDCRVGLDRLLTDEFVDFHAFVVVAGDDRRWALDVTHCSGDPLAIEPGSDGTHPAYPVAFESDGDRLLHSYTSHSQAPGEPRWYAVLSTHLDAADVRSFCEVARTHGMRARSLYQRRFTRHEMIDARPSADGRMLIRRRVTADGTFEERFGDPDEAFAAIGYGTAAVGMAERAGLIERSRGGAVRWVPHLGS